MTWKVDPERDWMVIDDDDFLPPIAVATVHGSAEAAPLIAAAPEMLELLREVAPLLRTLARRMPDVVGLTEDDGETPVSRVERLLARIDGKETP